MEIRTDHVELFAAPETLADGRAAVAMLVTEAGETVSRHVQQFLLACGCDAVRDGWLMPADLVDHAGRPDAKFGVPVAERVQRMLNEEQEQLAKSRKRRGRW